jgi:ElaB/YqjD/DUF883 family membrane-anchored ribosome-binding protein
VRGDRRYDDVSGRSLYDDRVFGSNSWIQTIADNPVPAALASLGVGWLLQRRRAESRGMYEGYANDEMRSAGSWRESARELADDARDRVTEATSRTTDQMGRMSRQVSSDVSRMFRQNPLAFGLAAAALGVAIGLSVPETETENELLGDTRDALVDRARDAANSAMQTLGG